MARYSLRSHQQMAFAVERGLGHEDFIVSLALTVHAAGIAIPRRARLRSPGHSMHEYGR